MSIIKLKIWKISIIDKGKEANQGQYNKENRKK